MGQHVTDVGFEKESKQELKKHAATIHCSNTLTLLQRKITNALLYHAYKELMLKEEHEITVKQLCRLIGYQGNNHAVIRDALKELISTIIEWNVVSDATGEEVWTASSIIASVSLDGPLCYYAYSPRMKQLLHSPSMFGKIDLVIQSKFRSSYGLALYENCIRYRGLPHTKWFEMDLFKKLMGVLPGKYDIFRDFKKRVLDKAVDEVNTYSDLVIASEVIKEGRKVVRIRFSLKDRAKKVRLGTNSQATALDVTNGELSDRIRTLFNLSAEQVERVLKEYERDYILDKIAVIENSKPYQEGRVENLAGYLLSALKHDYQAPKAKTNQPVNFLDAKQALELSSLKTQVEAIHQQYVAYREHIIHSTIDDLPSDAKKHFMDAFYLFAEPQIQAIIKLQRHKYTRDNILDAPQMRALLRQFAVRELDTMTIISLEEFVANQSESERDAWQKLKSCDPEHALLHSVGEE